MAKEAGPCFWPWISRHLLGLAVEEEKSRQDSTFPLVLWVLALVTGDHVIQVVLHLNGA